MSKFKSFASQGSFRDYQLQAPDETAKIREQTAKTIRGKDRAQAFLEKNNEIYLRAQQLANQQEEASRQKNFELETANRKAFRDALDRDYQIQTQNDKIRAAQQQETFKQLSAFSKTAFELGTQLDALNTQKQTKTNAALTILAGTTIQDNMAIQAMDDNLTKAEFAQQDLIIKLVKEGKDKEVLWDLYGRRNTKGYIENSASTQNTAKGLDVYLNQVELNLSPDLTAAEKKLALEGETRKYLGEQFSNVNPKLVNSIAGPIINSIITRRTGEADREIKKENLAKIKRDKIAALNTMWDSGRGVAGVHEHHTTDPSPEKRSITYSWMVSRLESGTLSPEEAEGILTTEYVLSEKDKTTTTWKKQFPDEVGVVYEAIRKARRTSISEYKLREEQDKINLDSTLREMFNERIADGNFTTKDYNELEAEAARAGIPQYDSPILKEAYEQQDSVRTSAAYVQYYTTQYAAGKTISVEEINSKKGLTFTDKQAILKLANQQKTARDLPAYKTDIDAIKAAVSQDPRIKAAPVTGKENYSVLLMQDRYTQMYNGILNRTGDHNEARATTLTAIQTLLANSNAINAKGQYTEIVKQEAALGAKGERNLKNYKEALDVIRNPETRNDNVALANALGAELIYSGYETMKAGKPAPQVFKNISALLGKSPLDLMNGLAATANMASMPPLTLDAQVEQIRENIKPLSQMKRYRPYTTNEMIGAANMIDAGLPLPVRGQPARPLTSFAPQVSSIVMEADDGQPGMDIFFEDKQFPAVLSGVVKEIGWQGNSQAGYGNYVVIESTDPSTGQKVDVLYAHLAMPTHLKEGSSVSPGMVIGKQGGTGSVRSADGTIASIDFLAPAPKGSTSMVPYKYFKQLREQIRAQLTR